MIVSRCLHGSLQGPSEQRPFKFSYVLRQEHRAAGGEKIVALEAALKAAGLDCKVGTELAFGRSGGN